MPYLPKKNEKAEFCMQYAIVLPIFAGPTHSLKTLFLKLPSPDNTIKSITRSANLHSSKLRRGLKFEITVLACKTNALAISSLMFILQVDEIVCYHSGKCCGALYHIRNCYESCHLTITG